MNYNETSLRKKFLYEDCAYLQGKINGHGCFPNSTRGTNKGILARFTIIAYCRETKEESEVSIAKFVIKYYVIKKLCCLLAKFHKNMVDPNFVKLCLKIT
jgi:hypothetical protein